jgi:hypothetical protein
VTTYPSNAIRDASGDVPSKSDATHKYVTFDKGLVVATADPRPKGATFNGPPVLFPLPPAVIAQKLKGRVIP